MQKKKHKTSLSFYKFKQKMIHTFIVFYKTYAYSTFSTENELLRQGLPNK